MIDTSTCRIEYGQVWDNVYYNHHTERWLIGSSMIANGPGWRIEVLWPDRGVERYVSERSIRTGTLVGSIYDDCWGRQALPAPGKMKVHNYRILDTCSNCKHADDFGGCHEGKDLRCELMATEGTTLGCDDNTCVDAEGICDEWGKDE